MIRTLDPATERRMDLRRRRSLLRAKAAEQSGFITQDQAREIGISRAVLSYHSKSTSEFLPLERVVRGLYRFRDAGVYPNSDIVGAWLVVSTQIGERNATVSHDSALFLHDLADIQAPLYNHITIVREKRSLVGAIDRIPPRSRKERLPLAAYRHFGIKLHTTQLQLREGIETERRFGVCVTTPFRTVLDCAGAQTSGEELRKAVGTLLRRTLSDQEQAEMVARLLEASRHHSRRSHHRIFQSLRALGLDVEQSPD